MAQLSLGHYKIQNEVLLHLQKENEKNEEK